jgi:hypothetical protein
VQPLASWLHMNRHGAPFVNWDTARSFGWVAVPFALAVGLRQSAWELAQGTYPFLLHRPLRRRTIFLTKLATGAALLLACTAVPVVLCAWWAATPGHLPAPFEWSMTGRPWRLTFLLPLVYLGAFLTGLHPGRWVGTRLLPLAGGGLFAALLLAVPWWWTVGLPLAVLAYALLTAAVCHTAGTRDYA